jgi:hypothetical protein
MTFSLRIHGRTRAQIDAELEQFAELIRAPMNASPQPVEIIAPTIDVLRPGRGQQAVLALLELVRQRFDPEGYEATVVERDGRKRRRARRVVQESRRPQDRDRSFGAVCSIDSMSEPCHLALQAGSR